MTFTTLPEIVRCPQLAEHSIRGLKVPPFLMVFRAATVSRDFHPATVSHVHTIGGGCGVNGQKGEGRVVAKKILKT